MAKHRGFRADRFVIDEFSGMHPSEQAKQRGWGDDWDNTPGGVILRPIPLGTVVEFYDMACDRYDVGKVVKRETQPGGSTYHVELPDATRTTTVPREYVSIIDRSPEGIEDFIEPDRPRTAEEIERWLGDA